MYVDSYNYSPRITRSGIGGNHLVPDRTNLFRGTVPGLVNKQETRNSDRPKSTVPIHTGKLLSLY